MQIFQYKNNLHFLPMKFYKYNFQRKISSNILIRIEKHSPKNHNFYIIMSQRWISIANDLQFDYSFIPKLEISSKTPSFHHFWSSCAVYPGGSVSFRLPNRVHDRKSPCQSRNLEIPASWLRRARVLLWPT